MDDKKKKNKNNSPLWIVFVVLYFFLKLLADGDGADPALVIILFAMLAVIAGVISYRKKAKSDGAGQAQARRAYQPDAQPKSARRQAESKTHSVSTARQTERYTPDNGNRYVAQLNGFLKNGIIDAKEYKTMLERYKKNGIVR